VTPSIGGTYRARVLNGELRSDEVAVNVRPRLTILASQRRARPGSSVRTTVWISPATAVRSVDLVRYDRALVRWRRIATLPVKPGKNSVRFVWQVNSGVNRVRASLASRNLRPGYTATTSAQVIVKGQGEPIAGTGRPRIRR
jgi:hypothetical protein